MTRLRALFLSGLAALLPVVGTIYVLVALFRWVDGLIGGYLYPRIGYVPGLGLFATLCLVLLTGLLATNLLGRRLLACSEALFLRMPVARTVYATLKQFLDAFSRPGQGAFTHVVLIEYPRPGVWALGFITGRSRIRELSGGAQAAGAAACAASGETLCNVFVPTTPNPTSGFLLLLPESQVKTLAISVEEGMRFIVSGGVVQPPAWQDAGPGDGAEAAEAEGAAGRAGEHG